MTNPFEALGQGAGTGGRAKSYMAPCILLELMESSTHGYDLLQRLGAFGFGRPHSGTLYKTLRQLEDEGLVHSRWELSTSGPARRTYRVTVLGRAHLRVWAWSMQERLAAIERFRSRHAKLPKIRRPPVSLA